MASTHTGNLPIPQLPPAATEVDIIPALADTNLVAIGQLCDADCTAIFTKDKVTITTETIPVPTTNVVLTGTCSAATNNLWHIPLEPSQPTAQLATSTPGDTTADLVAYSHASLGSPVVSTVQHAITKDWLTNFPGLKQPTFNKNLPHTTATAKGHMHQQHQGT